MVAPGRPHRRAVHVFLVICAVMCLLACLGVALLFGWADADDARGRDVDADVTGIQLISSGRRVYFVRFEVNGRVCSSRVDSGSNPAPRDVHVGGTSRLHSSASDPCNVRETEESRPGQVPIGIIFLAVVLGTVTWIWWLRPALARWRRPSLAQDE